MNDMSKPLVAVLYNKPLLPIDHPAAESEHSVLETAGEIVKALEAGGFRVAPLPMVDDPMALWHGLQKCRPDVVFNLYEGNHHHPETESYVAGLLEWSAIP